MTFHKLLLILFLAVLIMLPEIIIAQAPIMIITCKRGPVDVLKQDKDRVNSNLKSYELVCDNISAPCPPGYDCQSNICIPTTPSCLTCSSDFELLWNDEAQGFVCSHITVASDPPLPSTSPDGTCDCTESPGTVPGSTVINSFDVSSNVISTLISNTCVFPDCYDGTYETPVFDCDEIASGNVNVTICGIPTNSFLTLQALANCEFAGGTTFAALAAIAPISDVVGLGVADMDGCISFELSINDPTIASTIEFDGSPDLIIPAANVCVDEVEEAGNPIPTLDQWGLIALGLLLVIFGVARIKEMEQQKEIVTN